MSKKLIIFGSEGALGSGATKQLLEKGYDYYYLVNRSFDQFSNSCDCHLHSELKHFV